MRIAQPVVAVVLFSLLAPIPAAAQDFVITVPVQFSKLPTNVKSFSLKCQVLGAGDGRTFEEVLGKGTVGPVLTPSGGTGALEMPVPVTTDPGKDRTKVNKYNCSLWFTAVDATNGASVDYFRSDDPSQRKFPLAAGAPLALFVTGAIQP